MEKQEFYLGSALYSLNINKSINENTLFQNFFKENILISIKVEISC